MPEPEPKSPNTAVAKSTGPGALTKLNAVIRKAQDGNKEALAEVRQMLAKPGIPDILGGNLAKEALNRLIKAYAGENPVVRESVGRKLDEMRAELSGPNPTAVEKLLVERVLATWLHLHHIEVVYAGKEGMSLSLGAYYQKSISAAQKRYLAALKGLAEVRKFAIPALQINIAKKQVNVGTGAVAS